MSQQRRFTDAQLDEAEALRTQGEKWVVVEAMLGQGIQGACEYRRMRERKNVIVELQQRNATLEALLRRLQTSFSYGTIAYSLIDAALSSAEGNN